MSRKRVALFVFLRQSLSSRLRPISLDLVAASFQLAESAKMKSRRHEEARWNQRRHYRLGPTGMQSCGQTPLTARQMPPQFSRCHSRGGWQSHPARRYEPLLPVPPAHRAGEGWGWDLPLPYIEIDELKVHKL